MKRLYSTTQEIIEAIRVGRLKRSSAFSMMKYYKDKDPEQSLKYKIATLLTGEDRFLQLDFEIKKNSEEF